MAESTPPTSPLPAWRTCLDVESQAPGRYPDHVNTGLLGMIEGTPRRVLELGCGTGAFGAALKAKFPQATVAGIEAGIAPAAIAAGRLDRVVRERIDGMDFAAHGFLPGEFDVLVAADVLEHVVNPWDVLVRVRPLLAAGGQLVASIPNVRNALLIAALAVNGRWEYRERGLLDVTHLRFFTLEEIRRMLGETGYRLERHAANVSPPLAELFNANRANPATTLNLGRLTLADVSPAELYELCSEQFLVRATPS